MGREGGSVTVEDFCISLTDSKFFLGHRVRASGEDRDALTVKYGSKVAYNFPLYLGLLKDHDPSLVIDCGDVAGILQLRF